MCRFVAYLGKKSILLNELLVKPKNSLINQSRDAKEGRLGLNADGFGLGWYSHEIDKIPGVFKSTQPAWNDNNLRHLANKIKSSCFLAHVRASTVGDVVLNNCHPFTYHEYAFVHNGTIRFFEKIKRQIINELDDIIFDEIKAQTDSEHLFFLIMQYLKNSRQKSIAQAVIQAFAKIDALQNKNDPESFARMNIVITNGDELFASRYVSKDKEPLSLYYAVGQEINKSDDGNLICSGASNGAIIVASEPLTDYSQEWYEIPVNHYLTVDMRLTTSIREFAF